MNVIFVHGWGFDARIWEKVTPLLSDMQPHFVDLGFTARESNAHKSFPENAIAVGHSLGVMWLLSRQEKFSALVSINGFDCFYKHVPEHNLKRMALMLEKNPALLLQGFRRSSAGMDPGYDLDLNAEKLKEGLNWLQTWDYSKKYMALNRIKILASRDDTIVPPAMTEAIWPHGAIDWKQEGGHVLPLTHPQWCAQMIQKEIDHARA